MFAAWADLPASQWHLVAEAMLGCLIRSPVDSLDVAALLEALDGRMDFAGSSAQGGGDFAETKGRSVGEQLQDARRDRAR